MGIFAYACSDHNGNPDRRQDRSGGMNAINSTFGAILTNVRKILDDPFLTVLFLLAGERVKNT